MPTPAARRPPDRATAPRRVDGVPIDGSGPVSALGLDRLTLSRLARAGIGSIADLHARPTGQLWRELGRHGLADLLGRLTAHGLPVPALTDYEKWRLGLVRKEELRVTVEPNTPVSSLWPALGVSTVAALKATGRESVLDVAPRDEADVRRLYRLGRATLKTLESLIAEARKSAAPPEAALIDHALRLIGRHGPDRSGLRRPAAGPSGMYSTHHDA